MRHLTEPAPGSAAPADAPARGLCIVLHDVAPAHWSACDRLLRDIRGVAPQAPVSLLAVPRYHLQPPLAAFDHWLDGRRRQGHELVLHGYTHRDDGVPEGWIDHVKRHLYTAGEGEFAALPRLDAMLRLQEGVRWFERNRWDVSGFVAPAWLLSPGGWQALRALSFDYTCTLARVVDLRDGGELQSQSLVWSTRAAWRRALSLGWNAGAAALQRRRALLRLELHPGDGDHAAVRRSWMTLLERALADGRVPMTLGQALRTLPRQAAAPSGAAPRRAPQLASSTIDAVSTPITAPTTTSLG